MDVMRDDAVVELNRRNVAVLETNLQASQDRFEVGDLTRTDVAQSEARLAVARGQLETALAQLDTSLENYLRFVGLPARDLEQPPALPGLPGTPRSEEHTSELQSLMRISYAVFCLKKKKIYITILQQSPAKCTS